MTTHLRREYKGGKVERGFFRESEEEKVEKNGREGLQAIEEGEVHPSVQRVRGVERWRARDPFCYRSEVSSDAGRLGGKALRKLTWCKLWKKKMSGS